MMTNERTNNFIKTYLSPGGAGKGLGLYRMRADSRGTDQKKVYGLIRRMPYGEFLRTRYWSLVDQQVMHDAGWKCSVCGSRRDLSVHHLNYSHHGAEMFHIDELQCLCRHCHDALHEHGKTNN